MVPLEQAVSQSVLSKYGVGGDGTNVGMKHVSRDTANPSVISC